MRKLQRAQYFCVYILPTLCFLLTLCMYRRQRHFYEAKLNSIGKESDVSNYLEILTSN